VITHGQKRKKKNTQWAEPKEEEHPWAEPKEEEHPKKIEDDLTQEIEPAGRRHNARVMSSGAREASPARRVLDENKKKKQKAVKRSI
jgi:hypothetical protein